MSDNGFRNDVYEQQKCKTPLIDLPMDMVYDFAVADSLHLIDLGIIKTILKGFMNGRLTNVDAKWSAYQMKQINQVLIAVKAPTEIKKQRAIRTLDEFPRWKGREFRIFFLYLSIVVFRSFLKESLYNHYLLLFCGLTICYSDVYLKKYLNVAEKCIDHFLTGFKVLYGPQHMTSNFHNLSHLIDDVKRFGNLDTFNAYPFESRLYWLKQLLSGGNGKLPLCQVAKRISEQDAFLSSQQTPKVSTDHATQLKGVIPDGDIAIDIQQRLRHFCNSSKFYLHAKAEFQLFTIDCRHDADSWILLHSGNILKIVLIFSLPSNDIYMYGQQLINKTDFFTLPFPSSYINIFQADNEEFVDGIIVASTAIKCKLFRLEKVPSYEEMNEEHPNNDKGSVFIPIIHTIN